MEIPLPMLAKMGPWLEDCDVTIGELNSTLASLHTVLYKEELESLMKVKTTAEEAVQIAARNLLLLCLVQLGTPGTVDIGCPHCSHNAGPEYVCTDCRWCNYFPEGTWSRFCCTKVCFGGVTLNKLRGYVLLWQSGASFEGGIHSDVNRFLMGHIEWAIKVWEKIIADKEAIEQV